MASAFLATLLAVRDARDRVVAYTATSGSAAKDYAADALEAECRLTLDSVGVLSRLAGRDILIPVVPAVVRDGSLSRFASTDATWLIATDALDDPATRKAVDRLVAQQFEFALDGFPNGNPLSPALMGSTIVLDARHFSRAELGSSLRQLSDAGLRPMVRGIDDRAARKHAIDCGVGLYQGRVLTRSANVDAASAPIASIMRAVGLLTRFAGGYSGYPALENVIAQDDQLRASLEREAAAAGIISRSSRVTGTPLYTVAPDALMDHLETVIARMMGDAAGDPELAIITLRRTMMCKRLGAVLDPAPHPRTRSVAAIISMLEFSLGLPAYSLGASIGLTSNLRDAAELRSGDLGLVLDIIDAFEYGWWSDLRDGCVRLGISPTVVAEAYTDGWRDSRGALAMIHTDSYRGD